jgi:AcrR family transcriptional regulator
MTACDRGPTSARPQQREPGVAWPHPIHRLTPPFPFPMLPNYMTGASVNSSACCASRGRGRPRDEALHCRRCEQILEEAARVFADRGYRETDLQAVADALNIAKGTIYRYFASKEKLFLAAVERVVRQLHEHMDRRVEAQPDPLQRLATGITAYLEFFNKHPELVELFVQERAQFRQHHKPVYFQVLEERAPRRRHFKDDLARTGHLRSDVPVDRIMRVIGGLLYGTVFANNLRNAWPPLRQQAGDIADIVFHGILGPGERAFSPGEVLA